MFGFIRKNLIQVVSRRDSIETRLCFSQNPCLKSISTTPKGKETSKASNFTVSYLVNSCGLPTDSALRASKRVQLKTTENPDSVLSFFKNHGFTNTQIAKMISCRPELLSFNPDKTIKPKMDFLRDAGFSTPDLIFVLSKNSTILTCSLDNLIVPAYGFLKGILGTQEVVVLAAKRSPWLLHNDLHKTMGSKIEALRDHGVPDSSISAFMKQKPSLFLIGHLDRFTEAITKVKAMDIRPSSSSFYFALATILGISEPHWEEKFELYRSFGWSEDDILSAFKMKPKMMELSKDKIRRMMNFFLKEPGLGLSVVFNCPHLLLYSLEKTIIPRWSVIRVLTSHGILNKDVNLYTICKLKGGEFLREIRDQVPREGSSSVAGPPREDNDWGLRRLGQYSLLECRWFVCNIW